MRRLFSIKEIIIITIIIIIIIKVNYNYHKNYPELYVNFIPKNDRTANLRDVNPLETIWIIVDETTYKDIAPETLEQLRQ